MSQPKVLVQLDADAQASLFDAVVAVDSGVDHLLQYRGVCPPQVRDLVHGAMFTRGPDELRHTAIFVGGADVAAGEALREQVLRCFFGPFRVSVMLDANGANTTAAAAVLAAARHTDLAQATCLVLAGTGPVGQRVARLLARRGARVRVASRSIQRADEVCQTLANRVADARLEPIVVASPAEAAAALAGAHVVISAGAAGVTLLPVDVRQSTDSLLVAVDLNAVPPLGIEGIEVTDRAKTRDGQTCYGAIGVGGTKMKIHKAAIRRLFEANDQVLDAEEILALGEQLERG
jgi:hypothetical protein